MRIGLFWHLGCVPAVLAAGCFQDVPGEGDAAGSSDSDADETAAPGTTGDDDVATSAVSVDDGSTGQVDGGSSSTESTDGTLPGCTWSLEWQATTTKDVLVLVDKEPTNLGSLHMRAMTLASADGMHIAVASSCGPGTCDPDNDGYVPIAIAGSTADPLDQAAGLTVPDGLFRERTPLRVVLLTENDTAWDAGMLAADPVLGRAQLDVRVPTRACTDLPNLEGFAEATHGSFVCSDFGGGTSANILDDAILAADQPRCELFGVVADGPPPGSTDLELLLQGIRGRRPTSAMPNGPTVCSNMPQGWTLVDPSVGHLALCPLACRDVGSWSDQFAEIEFPCRR